MNNFMQIENLNEISHLTKCNLIKTNTRTKEKTLIALYLLKGSIHNFKTFH